MMALENWVDPENPTIDEAVDWALKAAAPNCDCADCLAYKRIERTVMDFQHLSLEIEKIAQALDPECPDAQAYVDGHCSLFELVTRRIDRLKKELKIEQS